MVFLAFHDPLSTFFRNLVFRPCDTSSAFGYILNKPLFPQLLNVILRFVLRLLDKVAKCVDVCGFLLFKEKLKNFELRLFVFFFSRFHGDDLGRDYDDYRARFYPDAVETVRETHSFLQVDSKPITPSSGDSTPKNHNPQGQVEPTE